MSISIAFTREYINNRAVNRAIGVALFVIATALGAYVRIPVPGSPVPITLQTFFVVLSGAVLGSRLGVVSQAAYLLLGAAGLPVFQSYAFGMAHILGPTGGYLAGFLAASFIVGRMLKGSDNSIARIIASFAIGNIALYTLGILWLMIAYRAGFLNAIAIGVLPFIAVEAVKILAATFIYRRIAGRSKSIFS